MPKTGITGLVYFSGSDIGREPKFVRRDSGQRRWLFLTGIKGDNE
jgi:hypothetical protein